MYTAVRRLATAVDSELLLVLNLVVVGTHTAVQANQWPTGLDKLVSAQITVDLTHDKRYSPG
eukprot:SAG11_NODE_11501_length_754_cov_1.659056_1_plen_62_part_00